jgi:NAD(P)-dependent dehydrogenase (short-subunit alcohol dehydrogenase family)
MKAPFSLKGETALITGGGSGLGLGIARCFVRAGARVILVGRRREVLRRAVQELGKLASCEGHDVTKLEQAGQLVARVTRRVGPISILVNNAGIHVKKTALETTDDQFHAMYQTHVAAAFSLTRAVLPQMLERRHGHILFIASMAALFGVPRVAAYSAAKSACLGLVRSLATEVSGQGVRVNAIAPGWIESELMRQALAGDPERVRRVLERTPMHRFGTAEEVGWAAAYLCSPAAGFVTGAVLPVDGGMSVGF